MLKNFRSYQMAVQLYKECEKIKVRHHLKDQMLRASLSVVLNLAEGSAKPTVKDRKRFYSIALASLRETQCILELIKADTSICTLADQLGGCVYRLANHA